MNVVTPMYVAIYKRGNAFTRFGCILNGVDVSLLQMNGCITYR